MSVELVEAAQRGDRDAFTQLAERHADRCYALAYRILRDAHRAEDATQQALFGAWRDLPKLRERERFEAWLHRLVVNACYVEARSHRRWTTRVQLIAAQGGNNEPDMARSIARRDDLEVAFRQLTPERRAVVVLHHYLGYSLADIAVTLAIPEGTVRSRLHYAVRQLRAVLDDERPLVRAEERSA